MSENSDHSHDSSDHGHKWYTDRSFQLAILGVVGTIIAAVISILPQFIGNSQPSEPTQAPIIWTATVVDLPTDTAEPIPPTETSTPAPTETTAPSPTPTSITPPNGCLDRWQIVSSNPDLIETSGSGDCSQTSIPSLGISASSEGIGFGINAFREVGTFGIVTSIPADATISLSAKLTVFTQGEFWIALSNEPNPETNMIIVALQSQFGEVKVYNNQTDSFTERYTWEKIISGTTLSGGPPYSYDIKFTTDGNKVDQQIHFTDLPSQFVNLPNYLFIGYSKKSSLGSMTLQAEITGIEIDIK
jgi:hypothetical protein